MGEKESFSNRLRSAWRKLPGSPGAVIGILGVTIAIIGIVVTTINSFYSRSIAQDLVLCDESLKDCQSATPVVELIEVTSEIYHTVVVEITQTPRPTVSIGDTSSRELLLVEEFDSLDPEGPLWTNSDTAIYEVRDGKLYVNGDLPTSSEGWYGPHYESGVLVEHEFSRVEFTAYLDEATDGAIGFTTSCDAADRDLVVELRASPSRIGEGTVAVKRGGEGLIGYAPIEFDVEYTIILEQVGDKGIVLTIREDEYGTVVEIIPTIVECDRIGKWLTIGGVYGPDGFVYGYIERVVIWD